MGSPAPPHPIDAAEGDKLSGKAWGRVGKMAKNKSQYPTSVFFILGTEFCERFSFYGMRAILTLYLIKWLRFDENTSTGIYHSFIMLCYLMPLFGAMIADGWLGKFLTILWLSILYCCGNVLMALTALPPVERFGPLIALFMIAVGTGGIKPCVAAFGGDQFASDQEKQLNQFFSVFYFAINVGSFISTLVTPLLRGKVHCFGIDSCFPLAFGVPAALMVIALGLFFAGKNRYKRYPPSGNVIGNMFLAIGRAVKNKCSTKEPRDHWLDYANDKYDMAFLNDVKSVLRVCTLFLPLPVFWALFDQQGSRWTLQAVSMDGDMGSLGRVEPDQMQALNSVLIVLFIPMFETIIYPMVDFCKIPNRPLQRMCAGMFFASLAFVVAGLLQLKIDSTLEKPLSGDMAELRVINAARCPLQLRGFHNETINLPVLQGTENKKLLPGNYTLAFSVDPSCSDITGTEKVDAIASLTGGRGYLIVATDLYGNLEVGKFDFNPVKPEKGGANVSIIYAGELDGGSKIVKLQQLGSSHVFTFNLTEFSDTPFQEISPGSYNIYVMKNETFYKMLNQNLFVKSGGVYTVIIKSDINDNHQFQMVNYTDVQPNQLSMFFQVPQYILLTIGEVMFSITGLSFAYSQAPNSMKSVVQAGWLMTVAIGNLIVVIVAESRIIRQQSTEFFVFASLMILDIVIFAFMAYFYVYVKHEREYEDLDESDVTGLVNAETPVSQSDSTETESPDQTPVKVDGESNL